MAEAFIAKPVDNRIVPAVRIPPHSFEAEQSVLGGLMLDSQAYDRIVDILIEADFYRHEHRLIFRTIAELMALDKPIDVLTVADRLQSKNELDKVGSESYLYGLANNTPTVANLVAYAELVRERSILRHLIAAAGSIADSAFAPNGRSVAELLDMAEHKVFAIAEHGARGAGPVNISTFLASTMERIDLLARSGNPITGIATGYYDLDAETAGFQASDLVIVAGRPSMGKTSFAMNIAEHVVIKSKQPVLVFSMEMPGDALVIRMLASLSRIDQARIRTGNLSSEDWVRVTSSLGMLSDAPLYIDDTPGLSPAELRARARRLAKERGQLGLVIVDYLQLMHIPGVKENRNAEISEISRSLKALAKELKVPVVALSQLNRGLEQRNDKRPVMSDLRESGAIEQDADLILFIYRDEVYHKDSPDKGIAEIIIAKQRNGPIGFVKLAFVKATTSFQNLARERDMA